MMPLMSTPSTNQNFMHYHLEAIGWLKITALEPGSIGSINRRVSCQ